MSASSDDEKTEQRTACDVLDTPSTEPRERIGRIMRVAARAFQVPASAVSLVGAVESVFGLDPSLAAAGDALVAQTLQSDEPLIVADARLDDRFRHDPRVTGEAGIRFYAGQRIRGPAGACVGALCVADPTPRPAGAIDAEILRDLVAMVEEELRSAEIRGLSEELHETSQRLATTIAKLEEETGARRKAQFQALRGKRQFQTIIDNVPVLIGYVDDDLCYEVANAAYEQWFGIKRGEIIGRKLGDFSDPRVAAYLQPYQQRALQGERVTCDVDQAALDVPGPDRHTQITYVPDVDDDGTVCGLFIMAVDVTEQRKREVALTKLAREDGLTGLLNRTGLDDKLSEVLARAQRSGETVAVMFLDLDKFKAVNDTHGHGTGDRLLREVALRLRKTLRATDTIARIGGDEFVIILEMAKDDKTSAERVAEKVLAAVQAPVVIEGVALTVRTSVGVAVHRQAGRTASDQELLALADEALYSAKNAGRNTYHIVRTPSP